MEFKVKGIQRKTTDDHYTRPQAQAYMIYDYPEKYLLDFEIFKKIFFDARRTITVAKKENSLFRDDTSNDGYDFTIGNRSDKLYELHGIKLFSFSNENYWKDRTFTPVSNDAMIFNNEALLNEERFIV